MLVVFLASSSPSWTNCLDISRTSAVRWFKLDSVAPGNPGGLFERHAGAGRQLFQLAGKLLMRLADALPHLIQRVGNGLLGHAPEIAEFENGALEFTPHPPRGFGQLQPGGGLGLDRVAPHLVEHDPQGDAGDGRGNRDAEILHDLFSRASRRKLIERDGETRQREQEPHVVEIVAGLVVAQAKQPRPEQSRIADHDQDRDGSSRQRPEIVQF